MLNKALEYDKLLREVLECAQDTSSKYYENEALAIEAFSRPELDCRLKSSVDVVNGFLSKF